MADLDRELAALRDAVDAPPMTALPIDAIRQRVSAGDVLCNNGPDAHTEDHAPGESGNAVRLRIYQGEDAPSATMVYAHGGGWVAGDLDYSDELCRHLAVDANIRVVSVDYRLAPEHPHPRALQDVEDAWQWTVQHYPGPWAIGGDSAGGNLAAVVASRHRSDEPRPSFQLLIYPVLGMPDAISSYRTMAHSFPLGAAEMRWFFRQYIGDATDSAREDVAPLVATDFAGMAPTYLVAAGHDPLHDEALDYGRQLAQVRVPTEIVDHPSLCHGFLRFTGASSAAREARDELMSGIGEFATAVTLGNTRT